MPANIYITIEDITIQLATYTQLRLYRSGTLGGTYSEVTTETLVAGQYHYPIVDPTGSANVWYKYTLYNPTGPVESDYSNVFRPRGTTRLRIRQRALGEYRAGIPILAVAGSTTELWKTSDYRVASELFRSGKHVGSWIMPTAAAVSAIEGATRYVLANSTPASGELSVEPWSDAPQAGDEAELHWLVSPDEWNDAIIRGLGRYWYLDRIPLVGVSNQNEYDLSTFPWLHKYNLHGVWYFPTGSSIEQPWTGDGKWYGVRDDRGTLTLSIYPPIDASTTLYLECSRPTAPLYTDDAQPPPLCDEALASALAYDEVLALLTRPSSGSSQDRRGWITERRIHAIRLNRLLVENRPRPRFTPPQFSTPPVVPAPYSAR